MSRRIGAQGHVYAFEPLQVMAEKLRQTLAEERIANVSVQALALGQKDETAEFVIAVDALEYSGLKERIFDSETRVERTKVEVRRLDDVIDNSLPVRYIKIDTEGGEWGVLRGAERILRKWRPFISFEFGANSYAAYNVDPLAVHAFLTGIGYQVMDINRTPLGATEFAESSRRQEVWDYLAVPEMD
ncbi:FkbM family methyltransferase [Luteimonas weifangensis]|uniref:FkbM family methyltransferase n=2 Tax=Cognatiluteimonas weifangensis TaxID=2303539 RepID=A0A372DLW5_9GAMM|nr:FkbM family methyltransferase [Luteimonas weifangensis]